MTSSRTARQRLFLIVGSLAVTAALGIGRPELVAIGAPLLLLVGIAPIIDVSPSLEARGRLDRQRALEGEYVLLEIGLNANQPIHDAEVAVGVPSGIELHEARLDGEVVKVDNGIVLATIPSGESALVISMRCDHWGTYLLNEVAIRQRSVSGLHAYALRLDQPFPLKVFPHSAKLRRLLEPIETRLGFGDLVSRSRGAGFEYADLRPYVPGDDPRIINWRVTARAADTWVTERHPERNADVVFMLDTFAEARRGVDQTFDMAVRAVASLVEAHGRRLDRVGLLTFGEPVRWLQPGMGDRHRYRVLDLLMESHLVGQQYWRGLDVIPARSLPTSSLVIALSPLLDERTVHALADIRARGYDLAIVELEPTEYLPQPRDESERIARRVWTLEREHIRSRFEQQGVAVAPWKAEDPFPVAILRADLFRRRLLRARV